MVTCQVIALSAAWSLGTMLTQLTQQGVGGKCQVLGHPGSTQPCQDKCSPFPYEHPLTVACD